MGRPHFGRDQLPRSDEFREQSALLSAHNTCCLSSLLSGETGVPWDRLGKNIHRILQWATSVSSTEAAKQSKCSGNKSKREGAELWNALASWVKWPSGQRRYARLILANGKNFCPKWSNTACPAGCVLCAKGRVKALSRPGQTEASPEATAAPGAVRLCPKQLVFRDSHVLSGATVPMQTLRSHPIFAKPQLAATSGSLGMKTASGLSDMSSHQW